MSREKRIEHLHNLKFFRKGIAKGSIMIFDEESFFKNTNKEAVLKLLYKIEKTRSDEVNRFIELIEPTDIYVGDISLVSFFISTRVNFLDTISTVEDDAEEEIYDFINLVMFTVEKNIIDMKNTDKKLSDEQHVYLNSLCNRFALELIDNLRREKLEEMLKPKSFPKILYVEKFVIQHLDYLPDHLKGIVFNKTDISERLLKIIAKDFLITLVQTNIKFNEKEQIILNGFSPAIIINPTKKDAFNMNKILNEYTYPQGEYALFELAKVNIFSPLNSDYNMDKVLTPGWYSGIALIKTEYAYFTKGRMPSKEELYNYFVSKFKKLKGKRIHLAIPDFREEKPINYLENITTDTQALESFSELFSSFFITLADAIRDTDVKPTIYVPNIRMEGELEFWDTKMQHAFEFIDADIVDLGLILETETAYENYLDYDYFEFGIIDLDNLIEEITDNYDRFSEITVKEFKEIFLPGLRDVHQHYRRRHSVTHHIVMGNCLENPDIMYTLLKMGFYNISVPHDRIKLVLEAMGRFKNNFFSSVKL